MPLMEAAAAADVDALDAAFAELSTTALFAVVRSARTNTKKLACVRSILRHMHSPAVRAQQDDEPILIAAVRETDVRVCNVLLLHMSPAAAHVNACDRQGRTALMYAAELRDGAILSTVLSCTDKLGMDTVDRFGNTALMCAARHGRKFALAALLGRGCDANAVNKVGDTALLIAIKAEHTPCALALMADKRVDVTVVNACQNTALIVACRISNSDVVCALLRSEQAVDLNTPALDGLTAIMWAAATGSIRNVTALLAVRDANNNIAVDVNRRSKRGDTALIMATCKGFCDVVVKLLAVRACNINHADNCGGTALTYAAQRGYCDIMAALLDRRDAHMALHVQTNAGFTPLHSTASNGHLACTDLLLRAFATDKELREALAKSSQHGTALHLAARNGHCATVKRLLATGKVLVNAKAGCAKQSALMAAAAAGHLHVVRMLVATPAVTDTAAAFDLAVAHNHAEVVSALLACNSATAATLVEAARRNNVATVRVLISAGARFEDDGTVDRLFGQASNELLAAFASAGTVLFGGDTLRRLQLWLVCNLKMRVRRARGPLQACRQHVLQGVCDHFGMDDLTGECEQPPQHLDVVFQGETGVGDGVRREWLRLASAEVLNVDRGLFRMAADGKTCNASSLVHAGPTHLLGYSIFGKLIGYALYHREPLSIQLSAPFLKALFGFPLKLADLKHAFPDDHCRALEVSEYCGDKTIGEYWTEDLLLDPPMFEAELVAGVVPITKANRAAYVDLLVQHRLQTTIRAQLQAVRAGLRTFFTDDLLAQLQQTSSPRQLGMLIEGSRAIQVQDWKQSCAYEGGFTADSTQVQWFWEMVRAGPERVRQQIMMFATASMHMPATGMGTIMAYNGKHMPFTLRQVHASSRLPTAHTCFNTISLPAYSSKDELQAKLLSAVSLYEGFDETPLSQ